MQCGKEQNYGYKQIKEKWKELGTDALFDFVGAFLQAVGVWCFIEPSRIAPGGGPALR